ncbi:MAG: GcrA family cell cycle regulator [Sphingomicrobium sp.]
MIAHVWTIECEQILREMWSSHSSREIADHLGARGYAFTRNAIIGKAHRIDLQLKTRAEHRPQGAQALSAAAAPKKTGPGRRPPKPVSDAPDTATVPFVPRVVETGPMHLTLLELTDATCKYECTKADDPAQFRFCGHPSDGTSYCAEHHAICCISPAAYAKKRVAA